MNKCTNSISLAESFINQEFLVSVITDPSVPILSAKGTELDHYLTSIKKCKNLLNHQRYSIRKVA
jgi:hypothetical protein